MVHIMDIVKSVFVDVDTQLDFVVPAGALYVTGAEELVPRLKQLTVFAASNQIPIISTTDAHSENDPEFARWKPHCVIGTTGQQKVAATLAAERVVLSTAPESLNDLRPRLAVASQIIVEKQKIDCFTNPNFPGLLDLLGATRYIVYGLATEVCVRCAAFGLLATTARVELVTDAIRGLDEGAAADVVAHFRQQGGILTSVAAITE
jgi:nicotinamidase/pyrazinamidase